MKKVIKPSPLLVILFGIATAICLILTVIEFIKKSEFVFSELLMDLVVIGFLVYFIMKYRKQDKIHFDENTFTVGGKNYLFTDITKVTVDSERVTRSFSTLRLEVYAGENMICTFTKDDEGAKEFISLMEKHGVKIKVYE